jgi:hypothetical protein
MAPRPRVNEGQIDTVVNYLTQKGVDPIQARKYALVVLGKSDITDITNETIGAINQLVNPNAVTLPNIEDEKAITDYIIGATSENYVKQLENEAYQEAAPEYWTAKTTLYGKPENPWLTRIVDDVDKGVPWTKIQTLITKANAASVFPKEKARLKATGFLTPFDNLTVNQALSTAKAIYDGKIAGDKNTINKKQKYLQADPFFSRGILPETFEYGIKTDYKNRKVAHPLAEVIKADADEQSSAAAEEIFGYTPSGLTSDVATRRFAAENKSSKKTIPGFDKPMNALELKRLAFSSAATQYLNEITKDIGRTPALDMAEQRLLLGTYGKK